MLESEDNDNGFVTINLDSSRCAICQLDTGEDLLPCKICQQQISMNFMRPGFNEMPLHANMEAHKGCMWKEHQDQGHVSPGYNCDSPTSPLPSPFSPTSKSMFDLMIGSSTERRQSNPASMLHHRRNLTQPPLHRRNSEAPPTTPPLQESPRMARRRFTVVVGAFSNKPDPFGLQKFNSTEDLSNKDAFNTKLQRLLKIAKNKDNIDDNKLYASDPDLIQQTHSSPVSRNNSLRSPERPTSLQLNTRRLSKSNLNLTAIKRDVDPKFLALKQSYAKYLFGGCLSANDVRDSQARRDTQHLLNIPPGLRAGMMNDEGSESENKSDVTVNSDYSDSDDIDNRASTTEEEEGYVDQDTSDEDAMRGGKEVVLLLSSNQLQDRLDAMNNRIKDLSNDLVDFLEERDELRHEVNVRHLTIEKLVQKEKAERLPNNT